MCVSHNLKGARHWYCRQAGWQQNATLRNRSASSERRKLTDVAPVDPLKPRVCLDARDAARHRAPQPALHLQQRAVQSVFCPNARSEYAHRPLSRNLRGSASFKAVTRTSLEETTKTILVAEKRNAVASARTASRTVEDR
eukprot:1444196-Pleurochrysis_carterae.AAC.1